jgi:hypothetical protein
MGLLRLYPGWTAFAIPKFASDEAEIKLTTFLNDLASQRSLTEIERRSLFVPLGAF